MANLHLNATEGNFEDPNQKFEFCKKRLTVYYLLALISMLKKLWWAIILAINHHDTILNSFWIRKSVNKKKKGVALLDHKYVYNAALNGCASPINIISFQT